MAGAVIDLAPAEVSIRVTQDDWFPRHSVEIARVVADVETPAVVEGAVAQVRRGRDRGAELVVDLDAQFSGAGVSFGGVRVPLSAGVWWWDLQVWGTFNAEAFDLTLLAGSVAVGRDVSHV